MTVRVSVDATDYKIVAQLFERLSKPDWARIRRSMGSSLIKAWNHAIDDSRIQEKTGELRRNVGWKSEGRYMVSFEAKAEHAKFQYYGTRRSRGRYVPRIQKRLVNPYRRIGGRIVKVDIGWHPGVNAQKIGLRRAFENLYETYAWAGIVRSLERILGVKFA